MLKEAMDLGLIRVWGKRYDLPLLVSVTEVLVETFREYFGAGRAVVGLAGHARRHEWPDPGRQHAREAWRCYAAGADAEESGIERTVIYTFGPVTMVGYLLGSARTIMDPRLGVLLDHQGHPVFTPDPAPSIVVLGPSNGEPGEYRLLHPATAAVVAGLLGQHAARMCFTVRIANPLAESRGQSIEISFPHGAYGAGEGLVDVGCTAIYAELMGQRRTA